MELQELRIGNWYYNKSKDAYLMDSLMLYDALEHYNEFNELLWHQIPLTEQWMLDFGFKKYDTYYTKKYGKRVKYHKVTPRFLKESKYYKDAYFVYNPSRIEINYVHQFQNLHFALTGEELTKK